MEDSFFEFRAKSAVDSESDSEIIDNSFVEDVLFSAKKKNKTVVVAESDESTDGKEILLQIIHLHNYSFLKSSNFQMKV